MQQKRNMGAELAWAMQEWVQLMVGEPDQVTVTGSEDRSGAVVVTVAVSPRDIGRVIGKGGVTARALRTVLDAAAHKNGVRAQLNIQEVA